MASWTLLQRLFAYWRGTNHPIFLHSVRRSPAWYGAIQRFLRATGLLAAAGCGLCYLVATIALLFNSALVVLLPLASVWLLLLALALGPTVAGERERATWETLRLTPHPIEELLLSRAAGALWWLRELITLVAGLVVVAAVGIGLISLIVNPTEPMQQAGLGTSLRCIWGFLTPVVWVVLFLVDRAQHFALLVAAALLASTAARSTRAGVWGAFAALCAAWLGEIGVVLIVVAALPDHLIVASDWLLLVTLGPVIGFLAGLGPELALLAALLTLAAREAVIRGVWRGLLRLA